MPCEHVVVIVDRNADEWRRVLAEHCELFCEAFGACSRVTTQPQSPMHRTPPPAVGHQHNSTQITATSIILRRTLLLRHLSHAAFHSILL